MSQVIRISDDVYERLKAQATPFVDTPAIVIERLLDKLEANGKSEARSYTPPRKGEWVKEEMLRLDSDTPEGLSYTKVRQATFDNVELKKPHWNKLVRVGHEVAIKRLGSYDALQRVTTANVVQGKYEEDGFTYLSDQNISVQGLSAESAWEKALHLAKSLRVPVRVEFEWRNRREAAHPGVRGVLEWLPED
jgi:predicted CopG family antitoxin